jgi:hypothetical protein
VVSATDPHGRNLGFLDPILAYTVLIFTFSVHIVLPVSDHLSADLICCYSLV